jgi:ABC-type enterochelin transport system ATPase subunit
MIDDEKQVRSLMKVMKENLPIPLLPSKGLKQMIQKNKVSYPKGHQFQIEDVYYFGDEAGITCDITPNEGARSALFSSLTHLRVHPGHCLAKEIVKYQKRRVKKLRKQHA